MKYGNFNAQFSLLWLQYPALLVGFLFFLGCLFALQSFWVCVPFFLILTNRALLILIPIFVLPLFLIYHFYSFPEHNASVEGKFRIHSIQKNERFESGWLYRGVLTTKKGRIHCACFSHGYHSPNRIYQIRGNVRTRDGRYYTLKITEPWNDLRGCISLAELRLLAKEKIKNVIHQAVSQKRAANFLTGLATGRLEDPVMLKEFGQLGLSHIMAISGFHFALLALVFHYILRLFLPPKCEALTLIGILTLYFFFIGDSPSIMRAWVVALVFLSGQLFEKRPNPLNSLGVAMLIILLINPLYAVSLSFQLSFLATTGILLFSHPCNRLLSWWIPRYPLGDVIKRSLLWQIGYVGISLLRDALSLTFAVHLVLFPFLLKTFHCFSFNSLIYNLFFPFLASFSLLLLILGCLFGSWVHSLNGYYSEWVLKIIETPPFIFKSVYFGNIPEWLLTCIFTLLLYLGIKLQAQVEQST